jgi:hypothetical protein
MEKEFIPYTEALALKELGFNEPCIGYYYNGKLCFDSPGVNLTGPSGEQPLPLYQQTFRWFREKYDLNYVIVKAESWFYTINGCNTQEGFNTYEEAELACLKKLIEIVKKISQDIRRIHGFDRSIF